MNMFRPLQGEKFPPVQKFDIKKWRKCDKKKVKTRAIESRVNGRSNDTAHSHLPHFSIRREQHVHKFCSLHLNCSRVRAKPEPCVCVRVSWKLVVRKVATQCRRFICNNTKRTQRKSGVLIADVHWQIHILIYTWKRYSRSRRRRESWSQKFFGRCTAIECVRSSRASEIEFPTNFTPTILLQFDRDSLG